jgi:hypothetical protein
MSTLPPGGGSPPPPVDPSDPCHAPACTGAKAELEAARAAFSRACVQLRLVTGILKVLRPIVSVSLWVLIVIVILAIVLWFLGLGPVAVFLWTLILIYAIAWILFLVFARAAAALAQELAEREQAVTQAIAKVIAQCPESCRGDLSIPVCDP